MPPSATVGGLVDIGGREKALGFWALWIARLPLLKMVAHGRNFSNLHNDCRLGTELRTRNDEITAI